MISGEKIGEYIAEPYLVGANDLPDLLELTKKYPYCSSLQLLYLKGLALSNDLSFEDQLKIAAIHAPDREHLYALIHSGEDREEISSETETEIKTQTTGEESTFVEEMPDEVLASNEEKAEILEEITEETAASVEVSQPNEVTSGSISSTKEETEEATIVDEIAPAADELEVDILNKAIDIAFVASEISEEAQIATPEETELQTEEEVQEKVETIEEEKELPVETETKETNVSENVQGELSFIQWLKLKQERSHTTEKEEKPTEIQPVEEETTQPEEKIELKKKTEKNDIDALLDKFIAEEPTISRPVKDFYNPVKNARESVQESDDLVTETLAKIHVMQKNYTKAISAYEKLILLYPEKKAFFASQIEKIEEEIKKR